MTSVRRLAAIVAADVVGFSRLMGADEPGALSALKRCIGEIVEPRLARFGGRLVNSAGDGMLMEFASPTSAVTCAVDMQRAIGVWNENRSEAQRLRLRIGVSIGDVIVEGDAIYGDDINIAFRLQAIAEPGGVLLSRAALEQIKHRTEFTFDDLGVQSFKNIREPVHVYNVRGEVAEPRFVPGEPIAAEPTPPLARMETSTPAIAVLPFRNQGGDPTEDYLIDGFTDDVIAELGRFKSLLVIARQASYAFRGREGDLDELRRKLNVQYVLHGSLRRIGGRLRVTAELFNAVTGDHLWGERYDTDWSGVFDIQDDIIRTLVGTLVGRVEADRLKQIRTRPPTSLAAYDRLLRGLEYHRMCGVTLECAERAIEEFQAATELDPNYARAHAWHACALGAEWFRDDPATWERCKRGVERALALDEDDPEANRIKGAIHLMLREYGPARHYYERAVALNPNDAYIAAMTAQLYLFDGDPKRAGALIDRAWRLDPLLSSWHRETRGMVLYGLGEYAEAVREFDRMLRPTLVGSVFKAASAAAAGDAPTAAAALAYARVIKPDIDIPWLGSIAPFRDPGEADRFIDRLRSAGLAA